MYCPPTSHQYRSAKLWTPCAEIMLNLGKNPNRFCRWGSQSLIPHRLNVFIPTGNNLLSKSPLSQLARPHPCPFPNCTDLIRLLTSPFIVLESSYKMMEAGIRTVLNGRMFCRGWLVGVERIKHLPLPFTKKSPTPCSVSLRSKTSDNWFCLVWFYNRICTQMLQCCSPHGASPTQSFAL